MNHAYQHCTVRTNQYVLIKILKNEMKLKQIIK